MSHNQIKIGGQSPSSLGSIDLQMGNLSNVSSTAPANNQYLVYSGSTFDPKYAVDRDSLNANAGNDTSESSVGLSIPNPYVSGVNRYFWEYAALRTAGNTRLIVHNSSDVSPLSNLYSGGATAWTCGLTFNTAGLYYFRAHLAIGGLSASGSYIDVQWTDTSYSSLGPRVRIGNRDERRNTVVGVYNASTNSSIGLYMHSLSGAYYNQTDYANILISVERLD